MIEEIEERLKAIQSEETNSDRYFVFLYNCWQHDYYEEPAVVIISVMIASKSATTSSTGGLLEALKRAFVTNRKNYRYEDVQFISTYYQS